MLVGGVVFAFLSKLLLAVRTRLKSRARLEAEILVLQQQVIVLSRKSGSRVGLRNLSLDKDAPNFRGTQKIGRVAAIPILGGLHHQYVRF